MIEQDSNPLEHLRQCRAFRGSPAEFWALFVQTLAELTGAAKVCILRGPTQQSKDWGVMAVHPPSERFSLPIDLKGAAFENWAETALDRGSAIASRDPVRKGAAILLRLEATQQLDVLALLHFNENNVEQLEAQVIQLEGVIDTPRVYQSNQQLERAETDVRNTVQTLDILSLLNQQKRFKALGMALCNEAKQRFGAERVSFGMLKGPYVRLQAISNMDRFEKKMDIVSDLEAAMEECVDQDEDLLYPPPPESGFICRSHEQLSRQAGSQHILSLPLRLDGEVLGALCFERKDSPFSEHDTRAMRLLADQVTRRVHEVEQSDRWFGARMLSSIHQFFGGGQHLWRKLFAGFACILLLALIFIRVEYRVEAPFILRSNALTHLPAPFEGYISEVHKTVGDVVEAGTPLVELDTSELLLEQANTLAEIQRHRSTIEKAEAERRLADMRVARAQLKQQQAALELIEYRLMKAKVRAPHAGVIVEGDLRESIGAPVSKGDLLMRLTRLENLYIEMKVDEVDIHDIQHSIDGDFAFNSKPDDTFGFEVERLEPVAIAEEKGNVFILRASMQVDPKSWWRPGMSGIAKINTGDRSLFWIFTHRFIDFLHRLLWW